MGEWGWGGEANEGDNMEVAFNFLGEIPQSHQTFAHGGTTYWEILWAFLALFEILVICLLVRFPSLSLAFSIHAQFAF